jgi:hypothetical protein
MSLRSPGVSRNAIRTLFVLFPCARLDDLAQGIADETGFGTVLTARYEPAGGEATAAAR